MTRHLYQPDLPLITQYSAATVIGLGVTGFSVVRYLHARGLKVTVLDSRIAPPMAAKLTQAFPDVTTVFGSFNETSLQGAGLIVTSPGVPLKEPILVAAKRTGAHIIGDVELFIQENEKPLIAITGSNGKSTVTTLVGEMINACDLIANVAGNIGKPALDILTDDEVFDVVVLELSSFQLETTSHMPADSAAILNVSADHMDRYDSMGDYVLAKARILRGAQRAVMPRHDEQLKQITKVAELLNFDLDEPANDSEFGVKRDSGKRWLMKGSSRLMKLNDVPLTGLHNIKNVLSAFALIDFLKLPLDKLVAAVKGFHGLPHRMQTIAISDQVTWVNDSKATNIGATSTALKNLESPLIWIAGGQAKGADFAELRDAIADHIQLLILFGRDAEKIQTALDGLLPIERVASLEEAVELAGKRAIKTSVVLLSPACASFDMFDDFEHRGKVFEQAVREFIERGVA